ncbi:hypothetical protein KL911_000089 [Ogataea haglerorum]|uniref:uncharacterized protein n=1 Tax=Ogataea haglerorum TaxID=1937702 RepID=UPI001C8A19EF|nr:uncharacterized protein KL911_000089 [Ogataea haglerorum]KAG7758952.1 hypothetical protein KL911_000089 [Ogataea haglerorum]
MSASQSKGGGFLRSMSPLPLLYGRNSDLQSGNRQLSSRDRKYVSNIEKALTVFDSVEEWADYISYLSKLQRALQTNPEPQINHWIPSEFDISKTLSKCLSPKLPSGVHRKALEVYTQIFEILGVEELGLHVSTWLPGLLPLMSYASISVKPQLIELFKTYVVPIEPSILRVIFRGILLSLLPALDDTTSESFDAVLELIDSFKAQLDNSPHFWQCLFLCIMTSPDKRLGALEWLVRRMPSFGVDGEPELRKDAVLDAVDDETRACVTPEPGLLIKAFGEGLVDENLLVQRGFFDLLIGRLQLHSAILQVLVSDADKRLLVLRATGTVLRKDMSLNRRLWNWLLGPSNSEQARAGGKAEQLITAETRSQYFRSYGLEYLTQAIFALLEGSASSQPRYQQRIEACRIAVAIMDKWEIGQYIVPKILIPIIRCTKETHETERMEVFDELVKNANSFFDSVETINIWSDVLRLIKDGEIDLVLFILRHFRVEEEDMVVLHLPLALLASLAKFDGSKKWIELLRALLALIPQRAFLPIEHADERYVSIETVDNATFKSEIIAKLEQYYNLTSEEAQLDAPGEKPYNTADLSAILLTLTTHITTVQLKTRQAALFYEFSEIVNELLEKIPNGANQWKDLTLLKTVNDYQSGNFSEDSVPIAFGISLLFKTLARQTSGAQLLKILKTVMDLLWSCLVHPSGKYQVETVKMICQLEISVDSHYIEAALSSLFLGSDRLTRMKAFSALWTHTLALNETENILSRPLKLLLDDLSSENETNKLIVSRWIKSTVSTGSISKVFQILCSGLLSKNSFVASGTFRSEEDEDFALLHYQLATIINLLRTDLQLVSIFKNQPCTLNNDADISILSRHRWDVTTYKSLLVTFISRFLSIDAPKFDRAVVGQYCGCVRACLSLLEMLIDGTEHEFTEIIRSLTKLCKKASLYGDPITAFYLSTISKFMRLAHDSKIALELFDYENDGMPPKFAQIVSDGVLNSRSSLVLASWISLILSVTNYAPELVFRSTFNVTACICEKLDEFFTINTRFSQTESDGDSDEAILELINGLQELLNASHTYLLASKSGLFAKESASGKESSFFGSVMQGVFQVEAPDEKGEDHSRRMEILKAFKLAVETCYRIWLWSDEHSKVKANAISVAPSSPLVTRMSSIIGINTTSTRLIDEEKPSFLSFTKTVNYNASRLKYRTKRILESIFVLEPLETLETLMSAQRTQGSHSDRYSTFKVIHLLDGTKSEKIIPLALNSLMSRVNMASLDQSKRSSMINELNDKDVSTFLTEYMESLSSDSVEEIWTQLMSFLKDVQTNMSHYRLLLSDILKFSTIVGVKLSQISFGEQKKVRKDMTDSFMKVLTMATNVKNATEDQSIASILNPINILPGTDNHDSTSSSALNSESTGKIETGAENLKSPPVPSMRGSSPIKETPPLEKESAKEELCTCLVFVVPKVPVIVQESDKVVTCYTTIINSTLAPLLKNKNAGQVPDYVVNLIEALSCMNQCLQLKLWKNLCYDIMMDVKFFDTPISARWNRILYNWIKEDKEKLDELVTRLVPYHGSSTLFNWNDSEMSNKRLNLKRMAYLLLISPKDSLLNNVSDLQFRVSDMLKNSSNQSLKPVIFLLLRVIIFKYSDPHLSTLWPTVYTELQFALHQLWMRLESPAEGDRVTDAQLEFDNELVLQACKLLDVLLVLKPEEFQLTEWLFVSDTIDAVYRDSSVPVLSLVDKISNLRQMRTKELHDKIETRVDNLKRPLLAGHSKVESVYDLREFFETLSIHNYESEYALLDADAEAIEKDIFSDLFG